MDYNRFNVMQAKGRFSLLDQTTGWVWDEIRQYKSVMAMMHTLNKLEFHDAEYKRLRRLEGDEWETELTHAGTAKATE